MATVFEDTLHSLNEETASLMIQLQLDDCRHLLDSDKGKRRQFDHNDVDFALRLYMEELSGNATIILDRRMTKSIAKAVQTDGEILVDSLVEEDRTAQDRQLAQNMSRNPSRTEFHTSFQVAATGKLDDELIEKLNALYVAGPEEVIEEQCTPGPEAETSASGAARKSKASRLDRRCISCLEHKKFFDVARAPCNHEYCRECLEELFETSLTDESLFPPRC